MITCAKCLELGVQWMSSEQTHDIHYNTLNRYYHQRVEVSEQEDAA
jgi:hypothetical protein